MKEITTIKEGGHYELEKFGDMEAMAAVLKDHIVKNNLFTDISSKRYVNVDGWAYAGGLMGCFPRIKEVTDMSNAEEIKWRAEVEIINSKTGAVISTGFAVCSNKESKKKSFDEYAVLSMAQTRAIGKAYRNIIGWVIKLGGYESTPQEEMVNIANEAVGKNQKEELDVNELMAYEEALRAAESLADLATIWKGIPPKMQRELKTLKETLKRKHQKNEDK